LRVLDRLAELYEVAASDLLAGWADYRRPGPLHGLLAGYPGRVDRRAFSTGMLVAGASFALPATKGRKLASADVARMRAEAEALYLADDRHGGAAVYRAVIEQLRRVQDLLDASTYSDAVGVKLQSLAGRLTEMAGRCAFDAGHRAEGRRLLTDALVISQLADDEELAVSAFAWLSRDASAQGAGRQAVDLAQAGARTAGRSAGPRLRAVLSLREGLGHALRGDAADCSLALSRSESALSGDEGDEPAWLGFMGPAVLHGGAAEAYLSLGQPHAAERAARAAIDANDVEAFPRNRGLYLGRLAAALVARDAIDEGAAVTVKALNGVRSGRLIAQLATCVPRWPLTSACRAYRRRFTPSARSERDAAPGQLTRYSRCPSTSRRSARCSTCRCSRWA
jgi:hypothetical protein